jgi:flavin-dependent dehydrogenase
LFDVIVVGSGPAGCVAAIAAARQENSVLLVSRGDQRTSRAGDSLAPRGALLLRELNLWESLHCEAHCCLPAMASAWEGELPVVTDQTFHPYGPWWHVDRQVFDAGLLRAAEREGVEIRYGHFVGSESRFLIDDALVAIRETNGLSRYRTGYMIDATGRTSAVARAAGVERDVNDQLVALVAEATVNGSRATSMLVEATPTGWWYSAPLTRDRLVVMFFTDRDLIPWDHVGLPLLWKSALRAARHTAARLVNVSCSNPKLTIASSSRLSRWAGQGWLAVGDAAMTFDPLSSEGLAKSIETGLGGGLAASQHLAGEAAAVSTFAEALKRKYSDYLETRSKVYQRVNRWPTCDFWRRRQTPDAGEAYRPNE